MNRIDKTLEKLKSTGKKMLSPYITAGDPLPDLTVPLMHGLVKGGADILELGIPFSDPMAEGPVIQHAMERALAHSITCSDVLNMVKVFRQTNQDTPVVIMGYVNPVEQYGYERFAKQAMESGVDGTILVDMPPEESRSVSEIWKKYNLYNIYLCSPTTSDDRMTLINQLGEGYLYYVSLKGVTGSDTLDISTLKSQYEHRKCQTSLPLMVGFGIKTPEMAAQITEFADGVIIGASLINEMMTAFNSGNNVIQAGETVMSSMRCAIDNGK